MKAKDIIKWIIIIILGSWFLKMAFGVAIIALPVIFVGLILYFIIKK